MTERDYRLQGWGHACVIERKGEPEENSFKGYIFGSHVSEDDTVLLKMESGKVGILKLDRLRWPGDPHDLFWIDESHFIGYKGHE